MATTEAWLVFREIMAGLDRQTAQILTSLWEEATTPQAKYGILMDVMPGAVEELSSVGAQAAVDLYTQMRAEAAISVPYTPTPSPGVPAAQTEAMIRSATSGWLDGRDATKVLSELSGGARRLVRYPARDTIIANTRRDPARPRFARVASPRACPWCLMLVSRGAVYQEQTGRFRAHDHCRCDATPVFNDSQIPEQSRQLAEEWNEVTAGTRGPDEAQDAWAEHIKTKTGGAGGGGGGKPPQRRAGADDEGWSKDERKLVDYLRSLGHEVERIPESSLHGVKSPDALVDRVTTEFKVLDSNESRAARGQDPATVKTLISSAKRSKKQADDAIIDARNTSLSRDDAVEALRRLKGSPQIESNRIRFVGNGFDVSGDVR